MIKRFFLSYSSSFVSKWVVLLIDLSLVGFSVLAAYMLRFNFELNELRQQELLMHLLVIGFVFLCFFLLGRTYRGIIRHTGIFEVSSVFVAVTAATLAIFIVCRTQILCGISFYPPIPLSILLISYLSILFSMVAFRLFVKLFYMRIRSSTASCPHVLIYGAGQLGQLTKATLEMSAISPARVMAFIDDNPSMAHKRLLGKPILPLQKALKEEFLAKHNISELIIAIRDLDAERKQQVVDLCLERNLQVKTVPSVEQWINGKFSARQIQKVRFEDLLERPPIVLENEALLREISEKTVMVTGAAGSIGSGLVKLLYRLQPARLIMVDTAETPLFNLEQSFSEKKWLNHSVRLHYHIADVSNQRAMNQLFATYKPHIVYHAAAYKHVPMMESNPQEAIRVNVLGTRVVARMALAHQAAKFVLISTDKAVNPTSVMGASKRAAEIFVQSLNSQPGCKTRFITTRFGNVLGSNGSVIPIFERQIAAGGPIRVTHPEITRFFMTIPEACSLVLEAGCMGRGGEIFLFDMGKSVRIADVARKMIQLSGLEPGKDIAIEFTGLRPGEKLYEELLHDRERNLPTHHPRILIGKVQEYDFQMVVAMLDQMAEALQTHDPDTLVALLKELIPEYVSNNSVFQKLDGKKLVD